MFTGRSYGGSAEMSTPSIRMLPRSGFTSPARMRSSVLLPEPEPPSSANSSPW